ncbi:hypothetical protein C6I20_13245 [Aeromicrobium sp. A1-2]|uniref:DUF2516 family protein n=1 Tax=Aeromicrobium sp. A1-2 TaxID=2107713 RepID=UPI000E4B3369|nr:DUF2516 family protein [Aeromicrobium sp. A1-2]AXT86055.1 hypothetical protein C6I20_13245 [Aeromicrobium sp. A1-2]
MFEIQSNVMIILSIALFAAKGFALVDSVARPSAQFTYIETLPKQTWIIILVLAVLAHLLWWAPLGLLNLLGTVAALVYLAQVRGSSH